MFKILLIDDDPEEYELISWALESLEIKSHVIQADDCVDVHKTILEHRPDIVFMDINMPYLNGIECLKSVRADSRFNELPIIIYSTSSNFRDVSKAFHHKANLYVVKPFSLDKLIHSFKKILSVDWNIQANLSMDKFLIAL